MGRFVFVILIFALVINPEVQARAKPYTGWLLDPVYEWQVRSRVAEIARALDAELFVGRSIPTSAALPDFLNAYFHQEDASVDPWGIPYFLARDTWTVRVASAGRDRTRGTADDIRSDPIHTSAY